MFVLVVDLTFSTRLAWRVIFGLAASLETGLSRRACPLPQPTAAKITHTENAETGSIARPWQRQLCRTAGPIEPSAPWIPRPPRSTRSGSLWPSSAGRASGLRTDPAAAHTPEPVARTRCPNPLPEPTRCGIPCRPSRDILGLIYATAGAPLCFTGNLNAYEPGSALKAGDGCGQGACPRRRHRRTGNPNTQIGPGDDTDYRRVDSWTSPGQAEATRLRRWQGLDQHPQDHQENLG
jgi:hypothetical protein